MLLCVDTCIELLTAPLHYPFSQMILCQFLVYFQLIRNIYICIRSEIEFITSELEESQKWKIIRNHKSALNTEVQFHAFGSTHNDFQY